MRDGVSDGFFTRAAHDTHPVDLMSLYLLHGSAAAIPGLPADPDALSFTHLDRLVRAVDRSRHGDADTFSLRVARTVRGRRYGLEFRLHFVAGAPYADALVTYGATVELPRFLHHFRAHHAPAGTPGEWDFTVHTDRGDLRESVVRFGNDRQVWFQINRGPVTAGRGRPVPWARGRLLTGRLQGNGFGAPRPPEAGGPAFPDRHDTLGTASPEARAYRRYVARLSDPLPVKAGRPDRTQPGPRPRRRPTC
ncbi:MULTISPECIES: hypothetical protein [unclassified Streptomyces]|uniref:hypothetical protein n=1 Tax=unclassified Streptomyces TaxID=2593676 RepID=UPI003803C191